MNLKQRIQRLEEIAHRRLADEAALASLPVEEPQSLEDLRRLDAGTLTDMCMDLLRGHQTPDTAEFHRMRAHYRHMPFQQLLRLYPRLKRRHRHLTAQRDRRLTARRVAARAELDKPQPDLTVVRPYDPLYQHAIAFRRLLSTLCWQ